MRRLTFILRLALVPVTDSTLIRTFCPLVTTSATSATRPSLRSSEMCTRPSQRFLKPNTDREKEKTALGLFLFHQANSKHLTSRRRYLHQPPLHVGPPNSSCNGFKRFERFNQQKNRTLWNIPTILVSGRVKLLTVVTEDEQIDFLCLLVKVKSLERLK